MLEHNRLQVRNSISREHAHTEYDYSPYRSHGDGYNHLYWNGCREPNHNSHIVCSKHGNLY